MKKITFFCFLTLSLIGCNGQKKTENKRGKLYLANADVVADEKMILGKWSSVDDTTTYIQFTKSLCNAFEDGKLISSCHYLITIKSCDETEGDTLADKTPESSDTPEYLAMINDDSTIKMCYSISSLDDKTLVLIYVGGNGSISEYRRKK